MFLSCPNLCNKFNDFFTKFEDIDFETLNGLLNLSFRSIIFINSVLTFSFTFFTLISLIL